MAGSEFRFKRFTVRNELSAMKVNTDGVILGAAMTLTGHETSVLDIGTGTGTIALMAAQRLASAAGDPESTQCRRGTFFITGIDIDRDSAHEAEENFLRSPWSGHLAARHCPLVQWEEMMPQGTEYDLIFSNPPYYGGDLKAPDARRCSARHSDSMSWKDIVGFSGKHLSADGRLALIIPADQFTALARYAAVQGFFTARRLDVRTVPGKPAKRTVAEFTRVRPASQTTGMLTIQEGGTYTDSYKSLLSAFLLDF